MAFERELAVARSAAREAADILRRHYEEGTRVWEKGEDNPVTLADLEADDAIRKRLAAGFPDDAILSEERTSDASRLAALRVWIVDPMDGTKEFTRRIPEFAVSIALSLDGEPVVAAIRNPILDVEITATRGGGTARNGASVTLSKCRELAEAVLVVSRSESERGEIDAYHDWFAEVRRVGSIAWKLACVASGDGDFNFSVAPKNEWDVCAGDLAIREAGGIYVDFDGHPRRYNQTKTGIAAGMAAGHEKLISQFRERERSQDPR